MSKALPMFKATYYFCACIKLAHRVSEWVKREELELREHAGKDFKSEIFLVS